MTNSISMRCSAMWSQHLVLVATLLAASSLAWPADDLKVYAAISLTDVLPSLIKAYQQDPATPVAERSLTFTPVYAASSQLAQQINAGAPAALFVSADLRWMNFLTDKGKVNPKTVMPLTSNRLVVIAAGAETTPSANATPSTKAAAVSRGKHTKTLPAATVTFQPAWVKRRFCVALPSVPLGNYSQQAMASYDWLGALRGKLATVENAHAVIQFVQRGECDYGMAYASDAQQFADKVHVVSTIPTSRHDPIVYPGAVLSGSAQAATSQRLLNFMYRSPKAAQLWKQYGFAPFSKPD